MPPEVKAKAEEPVDITPAAPSTLSADVEAPVDGAADPVGDELQPDAESVDDSATSASSDDDNGDPEDHDGDDGDDGDSGDDGEAATPRKGNKLNQRLAKLTKARRQAEREASEVKARLNQALDTIDRLSQGKEQPDAKPTKEKVAQDDPMPEAPEFSDPSTFTRDMADYTRKVAEWSARQAVKADRAERQALEARNQSESALANIRMEHARRREKAIETLPDYLEIAEDPSLPITEMMAAGITMDSEGPAIAYWLGKNPDEANRISKLPPGMQLMEIGAIRATILNGRKASIAKKQSLPKPISPVASGTSAAPKGLDDLDMESYAARRNEELRSGRG